MKKCINYSKDILKIKADLLVPPVLNLASLPAKDPTSLPGFSPLNLPDLLHPHSPPTPQT